MDEKITLDRKTFKALAQGTRITILKELGKRRKTQTELAKQLNLSNSTIKEHLVNLGEVDLVKQIDEGYKWKYYELTKKGKNIIYPHETKIWISLILAILALTIAINNLLSKLTPAAIKAPQLASSAKEAGKNIIEDAEKTFVGASPPHETLISSPHFAVPYT
ncbi:MAG: hypothetical protein DRN71_05135, partial [Candidatus Nanohalarchaeota archaeon]